jgi:hypothetical protein
MTELDELERKTRAGRIDLDMVEACANGVIYSHPHTLAWQMATDEFRRVFTPQVAAALISEAREARKMKQENV